MNSCTVISGILVLIIIKHDQRQVQPNLDSQESIFKQVNNQAKSKELSFISDS